MPKFGKKSKERLFTCHQKLQLICFEAISVMDFTVLEGHRTEKKQNQLFAEGKSQLEYPMSKHNRSPSLAVDIAPWPIDWEDRERFYMLAGLMFGIAAKHGITLRWGGTWGGPDDKNTSGFFDGPHFEIVEY